MTNSGSIPIIIGRIFMFLPQIIEQANRISMSISIVPAAYEQDNEFAMRAPLLDLLGKKKAPVATGARQSSKSLGQRLDAKRAAAAACTLHVGVVELETRAFQCLDVIDRDPVEIHFAHLVHQDL